MRALVTADWHADAMTAGVSRLEDVRKACLVMLSAIDYNKDICLFLFLGDLCNPDRGSRTIEAISLAAWFLKELRARRVKSIWISGNHDVVQSTETTTTLDPLSYMGTTVLTAWCSVQLELDGEWFEFVCLPYEPLPRRSFRLDLKSDTRAIVLSHCTEVPGHSPGTEADMPNGASLRLPIERIGAAGLTVLQGHYHEGSISDSLVIPGSPLQLTFGETHTPSFSIVDLDMVARVPRAQ